MGTKSKGRSKIVRAAAKLLEGTHKHLGTGAQVMLLGGTMTPAEVAARLQRLVDLRAAVDASKALTKANLMTEQAEAPALQTFVSTYLHFLKAAYGTQPDVLADFGISVRDRTPPTIETQLVAVAKRAATRVARNTMGPRQRLKVKGDVTGVAITPVKE